MTPASSTGRPILMTVPRPEISTGRGPREKTGNPKSKSTRSPRFGSVRKELSPDSDIRHAADAADHDVTWLESIDGGNLIRVGLLHDFVLGTDQQCRGTTDEDLARVRLRRH